MHTESTIRLATSILLKQFSLISTIYFLEFEFFLKRPIFGEKENNFRFLRARGERVERAVGHSMSSQLIALWGCCWTLCIPSGSFYPRYRVTTLPSYYNDINNTTTRIQRKSTLILKKCDSLSTLLHLQMW